MSDRLNAVPPPPISSQALGGPGQKISRRFEPPAGRFRLTPRVGTREIAMLAEIYLLRLETLLRASEEAARAENARFVPISSDAFRVDQARIKGKNR